MPHVAEPVPLQFDSVAILSPQARAAFQELCDALYRDVASVLSLAPAAFRAALAPPQPLTADEVKKAIAYLETGAGPTGKPEPDYIPRAGWGIREETLQPFLECPDLPPVAAVRLLGWVGCWTRLAFGTQAWQFHPQLRQFLRHYEAHHDLGFRIGLRELGLLFNAAGLDASALGRTRLDPTWSALFRWEPETTWPYFLEHPDLLEEALEIGVRAHRPDDFFWRYQRTQRRALAYEVLATFPQLPEQFEEFCWDAALGTVKVERRLAQKVLTRAPDRQDRLLAALANSKQDVRLAAADWLGQLGDRAAIAPLKKALAKEKADLARGALMRALERLGASVEEFLDRAALAKEAAKGLQKGVPEELRFLPFDELPAVHWRDSGDEVSRDVLTWLIVQAHKLKTPEPSASLRCYAGYFRRDEAEQLGHLVLDAWIAEDSQLPDRAGAEKKARELVGQLTGITGGISAQDKFYQAMLDEALRLPVGSAIKQKGVLAVAAACCGGRAAAPVEKYVRQWYGQRTAQCKALLQMLAWIDHPAAIQVLLAIAKRFRTRSIREEAERLVGELAERRDWTIDELSDRSIPTCDLDADGKFILDYGERRFTVRLTDDLEFALAGPDGEAIAALPAARKGEDEATVKAAKKQLTDAKKELKGLVKGQQERLYEAMCTGRTWAFDDWDAYLRRHPIAGRLCQRLVWAAYDGDRLLATFRPLADGSLTGYDDDEVAVAPGATLRLAHACRVPADVADRWRQHLSDYDVVALFDQLSKPVVELSEAQLAGTALKEFRGHLVEAFKLRGRATKLGYVRGETEDGGWFYEYVKHFPGLGLQASLQFSGNSLPEENRTVALDELHFLRTTKSEEGGTSFQLPLSEVPPVLLSECYHDLRTIAAEGTGFDPQWEKQVQG
jgi:hypothetical protein